MRHGNIVRKSRGEEEWRQNVRPSCHDDYRCDRLYCLSWVEQLRQRITTRFPQEVESSNRTELLAWTFLCCFFAYIPDCLTIKFSKRSLISHTSHAALSLKHLRFQNAHLKLMPTWKCCIEKRVSFPIMWLPHSKKWILLLRKADQFCIIWWPKQIGSNALKSGFFWQRWCVPKTRSLANFTRSSYARGSFGHIIESKTCLHCGEANFSSKSVLQTLTYLRVTIH